MTAGSPDVDLEALMRSNVCQRGPGDGEIPRGLSNFHFSGRLDNAVPVKSSKKLAERYGDSACTFVEHDQGHCFPSKAALVDRCVQFIEQSMLDTRNEVDSFDRIKNVTSSTKRETIKEEKEFRGTPSIEDIEAQLEEIEALSAIYPDDIRIYPAGATSTIDIAEFLSTGKVSQDNIISINLNLLDEDSSNMPDIWKGQFTLRVRMPWNYPSAASPILDLDVGSLSLHDLPSLQQESLISSIKETAMELIGTPSIMSCVQSAGSWLCSDHVVRENLDAGKTAVSPGVKLADGDSTFEAEDDRSEAETSELITAVSEIAGRSMASHRKDDARADTVECKPSVAPSASARGIWNYTVGLVGKPSAGKSTFYNVATRAALSRDGRLMAAVASHPFTTIEPNVGPGWWCTSIDNEYSCKGGDGTCTRGSRYGRSPNGLRYLPLIVKDVAGLVPGAYKGRGNKFHFEPSFLT